MMAGVVIGDAEYRIVKVQPYGKAALRAYVYFKGRKGLAVTTPWEEDRTRREAGIARKVKERAIRIPEVARVAVPEEKYYHYLITTTEYDGSEGVTIEYRVEMYSTGKVSDDVLWGKLGELFEKFPIHGSLEETLRNMVMIEKKEVEKDEVLLAGQWQYLVEFKGRNWRKTGLI